jgi:hypothetical protein
MQQMRLTRSFMGLLAFGLSLMPIAARADVAALFADLDGAQPNRGLAQMMVIGIADHQHALMRFFRSFPPPIKCVFVRHLTTL